MRLSGLLLVLTLIFLGAAAAQDDPVTGVRAGAEVETGLYGETGRLSIRLAFTTSKALAERYEVVVHVTDEFGARVLADSSHVPPLATDAWPVGETVHDTVRTRVPAGEDGGRPAALVLVGLRDPTLDNGYDGRLPLEGEEPFGDRRYLVARVPAGKGRATFEDLREAARERAERGETAEAFDLLAEALTRAETLAGKLAVTGDLLRLDPPPGPAPTGPEEVLARRLEQAEKIRWLGDRASGLLKRKDLRVALRVMERIGGVAEEERNTRVVGEPTGEERAKKDVVDVKYRLLRDISDEEREAADRIIEKADGRAAKLLAAAATEAKRERFTLARKLLLEVRVMKDADDRTRDRADALLKEVEHEILDTLTPEEERRLAREIDHPAFHRTATVATSRFVFLGPEGLVRAIPRRSTYALDVAYLLLTDLFGREPVPPGERIFVYFKETYSGPATGGGRQITVGDADPLDRSVRVDNGLYYHELTHCVDDTRPVHDYKRGLTEGLANLGAIFVADMFAGDHGRFLELAAGGRAAFKRHHLDRENAYWLIPAYGPSEGMLTEILARHAMAGDDHANWPLLGRVFRDYRKSSAKNPRTHRIMAHLGAAMADAMGPEVWETLAEFGFPVSRATGPEIHRLAERSLARLVRLARRGDVSGLTALARDSEGEFVAARARYAALGILDARHRGESAEADRIRRELGVVSDFRVIGPFYPEAGPGLAERFPPEVALDLTKEYPNPHGTARWRQPSPRAEHYARMDARGVVRLRYGYPANAVTYALAHVRVPEETEAIAWLGADDEAALWVNGHAVQRNHGWRPLQPDYERWPVTLSPGRNRILLKVSNHQGITGFSLRITNADGRAIEGMTTDLDPPEPLPESPEPKWETVFTDEFHRRSPGKRYEVAAGKFTVRRKRLRGEADGPRPGWRPFSVRPGFPQDTPAALLWLAEESSKRDSSGSSDFLLRLRFPEDAAKKLTVTWDGEGDRLPLSGWSLILLPKKKFLTVRLERYDYLHYLVRREIPVDFDEPVLEIRRVGDRVDVSLGGHVLLDGASAPPLKKRRIGLAVWGPDVEIDAIMLARPKD